MTKSCDLPLLTRFNVVIAGLPATIQTCFEVDELCGHTSLSHQFTKTPGIMRSDRVEYINFYNGLLWPTLIECVVFPLDITNYNCACQVSGP